VTGPANKVATLQESFAGAKKKMPTLKKALRPLIDAQTARIQGEIKDFEAQVEQHLAGFKDERIFLYETGVNPSYERLDELHKDLLDIETAAAEFVELATLFDFPEAMNKSSDMVKSMRANLVLTKKLWDLCNIVQTTLEEWQGTLWDDINVGSMEEEAKTLAKTIKGLDKRLRNFDAYVGLDTFLKNFLVTLPAVSDLRSPSMRERHWKLLMTVTGVEFDMGSDFSLAHLTALQLHKFVDDVGEVVDRAVKEDKMEQTLAKLKVTWAVVDFEFDQHRDTDVFLMKMKEEDFETLEDNQLVVQGMMASKYLATFEEEVTGWQKKLGNVSDVLAQMSEVQRKWAYLETLFIGSDEVKKELPESTERFVGIDKTFKECLGAIYKIKNAVAATDVEGQQKTLEVMANDLELCEKDLADFLESKRRIFPYAFAILHLSSHCRCLCLTLRAHSHSLTLSLSLSHTHTLSLSHSLSLSHTLSLSLSLTLSHTLSRARAPSTDASTSWPPRTCWTCFPMATGRGWSWGTSTTSCRASSR
jgi:dynein heavy chain